MESDILAENLRIGYSSNLILAKIDKLKIKRGEIVSIVGESGIGKTTFLKTIARLIKPIEGRVRILGNYDEIERGRLGYIPQKLGLIKHESVFSNVLEGAICNQTVLKSIIGLHEKEVIDSVDKAIALMELSDKKDEPVKELSGGQQRRVAIARTIAQNPKIILADEFLSELDDKTLESVWNVMLEFVNSKAITLIMVEHNIERAKLADRVFKMEIDDELSISFNTAVSVLKEVK
tara:strand:- start:2874 stop:3578 length:705 start_codon:yes stop_codon:yes gene_type:complete